MRSIIALIVLLILGLACTKELIIVPDNDPPFVGSVSTVKIENYVNRLFIDNIGREPSISEMTAEVQALRDADLSKEAREILIEKLQTDTQPIERELSYQQAYFQQQYTLAKIRCLEGASDEQLEIMVGQAETKSDEDRLYAVLNIPADLLAGNIKMHDVFSRVVFNLLYDEINMNTFNFVNATFDNLLWRFPTDAEMRSAYDMVENNRSNAFFGKSGQSKGDYVQIVKESRELFEGMIIWAYTQLVARRPTTEETATLLEGFYEHREIRLVQKSIMVTNEYANF